MAFSFILCILYFGNVLGQNATTNHTWIKNSFTNAPTHFLNEALTHPTTERPTTVSDGFKLTSQTVRPTTRRAVTSNDARQHISTTDQPSVTIRNGQETSTLNQEPPVADREDYIIRGRGAKPGQFPYMVRILGISGTTACGGALITPKHVLTAKHCAKKLKEAKVIIGEHAVNKKDKYQQKIKVKKFKKHDGADAAILVLSRSAQLSKHVKPIRIARRLPKVGTNGILAGWGLTERGRSANKLQWLRMHMGSKEDILENGNYTLQFYEIAVGTGKRQKGRSCNGDSGSPWVSPEPGHRRKPQVVGILSAGNFDCPDWERYSVFVCVPCIFEWVVRNAIYYKKGNNKGNTIPYLPVRPIDLVDNCARAGRWTPWLNANKPCRGLERERYPVDHTDPCGDGSPPMCVRAKIAGKSYCDDGHKAALCRKRDKMVKQPLGVRCRDRYQRTFGGQMCKCCDWKVKFLCSTDSPGSSNNQQNVTMYQ